MTLQLRRIEDAHAKAREAIAALAREVAAAADLTRRMAVLCDELGAPRQGAFIRNVSIHNLTPDLAADLGYRYGRDPNGPAPAEAS